MKVQIFLHNIGHYKCFLNILKNSFLASLKVSWFFMSKVKIESLCLLQLKLSGENLFLSFHFTSISRFLVTLSPTFSAAPNRGGILEFHFWKGKEWGDSVACGLSPVLRGQDGGQHRSLAELVPSLQTFHHETVSLILPTQLPQNVQFPLPSLSIQLQLKSIWCRTWPGSGGRSPPCRCCTAPGSWRACLSSAGEIWSCWWRLRQHRPSLSVGSSWCCPEWRRRRIVSSPGHREGWPATTPVIWPRERVPPRQRASPARPGSLRSTSSPGGRPDHSPCLSSGIHRTYNINFSPLSTTWLTTDWLNRKQELPGMTL